MQTRWIVLIGVVTARVAFAFQLQTVAVIAPGLMQSFGFDAVAIGILTGLFMLPGLVFAVPSGMLSQKIGERPFLIGCLIALTAGGAVCAIADGYWTLWTGRLISGIGAIGINVAMSKIVIDWFADKELNTAMALFLTGFPAGIALALVSLGYWATPEGWPVAFFVAAGFSFLALILFVLTYRPAPGTGVQETEKVRLSLGEFGMVCVSGLMWAFYNAGFIIVVSFVPLYLVGEGLSAGVAASLVGVGMWIALIAGPFGGVIADRLNQPNLLISASVLIWGFGALLVMPLSNSIPLLAILFAGVQFLGFLPVGPMVSLTSEVLRPEVRAIGMGVYYTWLYGGLAVGPIFGGYVSEIMGHPSGAIYSITCLSVLTVSILVVFRILQARGYPTALSS